MTQIVKLIDALSGVGVSLRLCSGTLQVNGPLTRALRAVILDRKSQIVQHLEMLEIAQEWARAVDEVSEHFSAVSNQCDPLTLDDHDLEEAVGDHLRARDPDGARRAICAWRTAWLRCLTADDQT